MVRTQDSVAALHTNVAKFRKVHLASPYAESPATCQRHQNLARTYFSYTPQPHCFKKIKPLAESPRLVVRRAEHRYLASPPSVSKFVYAPDHDWTTLSCIASGSKSKKFIVRKLEVNIKSCMSPPDILIDAPLVSIQWLLGP